MGLISNAVLKAVSFRSYDEVTTCLLRCSKLVGTTSLSYVCLLTTPRLHLDFDFLGIFLALAL